MYDTIADALQALSLECGKHESCGSRNGCPFKERVGGFHCYIEKHPYPEFWGNDFFKRIREWEENKAKNGR